MIDADRCTAADVAAVLRLLPACSWQIILAHPWSSPNALLPLRWRRSRLTFRRQPGPIILWAATLPGLDGPVHWEYGCQRDDWTLGPDSQLVEPMALLSPAERQQLLEALAAADVTDQPVPVIPLFNGATLQPPAPPVQPAAKPGRRRTTKPAPGAH